MVSNVTWRWLFRIANSFLLKLPKSFIMTPTITWESWKDIEGLDRFIEARTSNMNCTSILWIQAGNKLDEEGLHESPILIWLN